MEKDTKTDIENMVLDVLNFEIRPFLKLHGGDCSFLRMDKDQVVHLKFEMACTACKLRPLTYLAAVRPRLMKIPGVKDIEIQGVRVSEFAKARSGNKKIL